MNTQLKTQRERFIMEANSLDNKDQNLKNLLLKKKYYKEKLEYLKEAGRSTIHKFENSQNAEDPLNLFSFLPGSVLNDDQLIREIITLQKTIHQFKLMNYLLKQSDKEVKILDIKWIINKIGNEKRKFRPKDKEIDLEKGFTDDLKKDIFQKRIDDNQKEVLKKIEKLKIKMKEDEKQILEKPFNFEEEIHNFELKIQKKYYAGEIRSLLDRICNKNLIFDDFEFSSLENEDLILLNLGFLANEQKFKKFCETVVKEMENPSDSKQLYLLLLENLKNLKKVLDSAMILKNNEPLLMKESDFFEKEEKSNKFLQMLDKVQDKKVADPFENISLNLILKAYLKLTNYAGKDIVNCQTLINNEINSLNEQVLSKIKILKSHFQLFNREFAELENEKNISKENFEKNNKKLENIITEIKKLEVEQKNLEENKEKLKKKYKFEFLKHLKETMNENTSSKNIES